MTTKTQRDDIQMLTAGEFRRVRTVGAAYTATLQDDIIIATASAGAFSITLPTAASAWDAATQTGKVLTFVNTHADDATIDGAGDETINGASTFVLDVQYERVKIVSNGTAWFNI